MFARSVPSLDAPRLLDRLDGAIFSFAKNSVVLDGEKNGFAGDFSAREFAGATYSPDGRWLFFNAQTPGITFAVTGPWADGPL